MDTVYSTTLVLNDKEEWTHGFGKWNLAELLLIGVHEKTEGSGWIRISQTVDGKTEEVYRHGLEEPLTISEHTDFHLWLRTHFKEAEGEAHRLKTEGNPAELGIQLERLDDIGTILSEFEQRVPHTMKPIWTETR